MHRPETEQSPTVLAHEVARGQRIAGAFEARATDPLMREPIRMAHLILAVALEYARKRGFGDLTDSRRRLATWLRRISDLPSMKATAPRNGTVSLHRGATPGGLRARLSFNNLVESKAALAAEKRNCIRIVHVAPTSLLAWPGRE
jgi:hypothetical protein